VSIKGPAANDSHHPARASKATKAKTADRVLGVHGFVMSGVRLVAAYGFISWSGCGSHKAMGFLTHQPLFNVA
jgi:hypothetical protein